MTAMGVAQRAPLKRQRSDDTLPLAIRKNSTWTPHDLRRTGATKTQALGISLELIDRYQKHVLAGNKIRRHYMLQTMRMKSGRLGRR